MANSSTMTTPWAAPATALPGSWTYQGSANGSPLPTLSVGGGQVSHVQTSSANASPEARYIDDLTSGGWTLDTWFVEVVAAAPGMRLGWGSASVAVSFVREGTDLRACWLYNDAIAFYLGSPVAYNATTMKYWRFRYSGGWYYWEYSADGINWTELASDNSAYGVNSGFRPHFYQYWAANTAATSTLGAVNTAAASTPIAAISAGHHIRSLNR